VLAACGALAVYRRDALEAVAGPHGPWAEEFFCFWEDLELGWRLVNAGWMISSLPTPSHPPRGAGAAEGRGPLRWRRPVELEACVITNRWMTLMRHLHTLDLIQRLPVLLVWDLALLDGMSVVRRPGLIAAIGRRWPLVMGEWRARSGPPATEASTAAMVIQLTLGFFLAYLLALVGTPMARDAALRFGVVDRPDGKLKTHEQPVAYLGGLAVFVAFLLSIGMTFAFDEELLAMLLASTIVTMVGLIDDFGALTPKPKVIGQAVAVFVLLKAGVMLHIIFIPWWARVG
jgi:hypothetical protein